MGNPYSNPAASKEVYFFMKNLMTRRIVLGLLMTLVLAFSVQGIANALTLTKGDGDFQNANDDVSFTITFTAGLTGPELKSAYTPASGYTTVSATDTGADRIPSSQTDFPYYYKDTGDTGYTGESRISNSAANYYNNEAVTISVSGASITHIGTTELTTPRSSHTLREDPYWRRSE